MADVLQTLKFDAQAADDQLRSFRAWMCARPYFGETEAVAQIRARPHMACLLAYTILMPSPDLYKFEFGIKGLFRANFVVGNHKARKFVLVEFEDAAEDSLFKGGTAQYRYWSDRLERGFGQIIDWAWAKHSHPTDAVFTNSFNGRVIDDCYVVICGRAPQAGSLEEQRFDYRRSLKLQGIAFQLYTYDDMVNAMSDNVVALLDR